jgi:hypothetical protein
MAFKLAFSTLRWKNPDLERGLEELKKAGWEGWECRLPLDWLGTPQRLRRICDNVGLPMVVYTASGSPDNRDYENVEQNKRRMEFAAEMGCDCLMYMNGNKPADRAVTQDDLRYAAEGAEQWAEYAEPLGLELSYHIHTNLLVDTIEDWRFYMSLLKKAKLCIDVSHAQLWAMIRRHRCVISAANSTMSTCRITPRPHAATTATICPSGAMWARMPMWISPPCARRWKRSATTAGSPRCPVSRLSNRWKRQNEARPRSSICEASATRSCECRVQDALLCLALCNFSIPLPLVDHIPRSFPAQIAF